MNSFSTCLAVAPNTSLVILGVAANLFVFFVFVAIWASRYTKVGPNEVLVISGRKYLVRDAAGKTQVAPFRIVTGGGAFVWPIYETAHRLPLNPFSVDLVFRGVPTRDGERADILAVGQVRVRPDDTSLGRAAQNLVSKTPEQIKEIAAQLMESSLRALVGTWSSPELSRQESQMSSQWQSAAKEGLADLGLEILSLSVRELRSTAKVGV
jgi:flotillin